MDVRNFLRSGTAPTSDSPTEILKYWKREALTRYTSMLAAVRVLLGLGAGQNAPSQSIVKPYTTSTFKCRRDQMLRDESKREILSFLFVSFRSVKFRAVCIQFRFISISFRIRFGSFRTCVLTCARSRCRLAHDLKKRLCQLSFSLRFNDEFHLSPSPTANPILGLW